LAQYAELFRVNDIDADVLREMTADDLKELGISSFGHRKKLISAIGALVDEPGRPAAAVEEPSIPSGPGAGGERRQLTVLFVDLVGSTALSRALDPEDLREVMRGYQDGVSAAIREAGGFVAKYLGDGVLAYFGYPQAREDAAEQAVRAGLGAIAASQRIEPAGGRRLNVRVGIATGPVVVGDIVGEGIAREVNVTGETPNLAARLLGIAEPGQVVIADATRRLVGDLFGVQVLGPQVLKGLAEPVAAYAVVDVRPVVSRFEAVRASRRGRFVGRGQDVGLLQDRWEHAKAGEGQVVLLAGEAGIGKSRICDAFYERVAGERHYRIRFQCSPQHTHSPLHPVIVQLTDAAGIQLLDDPDTKAAKLAGLLGQSTSAARALILGLLGGPQPTDSQLASLDAGRRRQLTLEALADQLAVLTTARPVLLLLEDAHWIDPSTQDLMTLMVARAAAMALLVVVTHRPEYHPPWSVSPIATQLALNRLPRAQVVGLLASLAGKPLPEAAVDHVVARTDGIPLYVEEMFGALRESGILAEEDHGYVVARPLDGAAVPVTLQDSLMARLDRPGPAKEVAQIGAVIGREFGHTLLVAAAEMDKVALAEGLADLVAAGLVFARGAGTEATYTFKHALVQDAAYGSLLRRRKQRVHLRIAEWLGAQMPVLAEQQPELVAHHYTEAESIAPAVGFWIKAAEISLARSANAEAVHQVRKGLGLIPRLPDAPPRWRMELALQSSLSAALSQLHGSSDPGLLPVFVRARSLSEQLDDLPSLIRTLRRQGSFHGWRSEYPAAQRIGEDLTRIDDSNGRMLGHTLIGWCFHWLGKYVPGVEHFERAHELYRPDERDVDVSLSQVMSWSFLAKGRLILGYPDRALAVSEAIVGEARGWKGQFSLCQALFLAALFDLYRRSDADATAKLEEMIPLATSLGFRSWSAQGRVAYGVLRARSGDTRGGLAVAREAHAEIRAMGQTCWQTGILLLLAECCERAGDVGEAFGHLDEAIAAAGHTDERWNLAELYRVQGEWSIAHHRGAEAEALFRRAIEVAHEQDARLWELRAACSLGRLMRSRGQDLAAIELVAPIYGWFEEGFGATDLQEARLLLDELRAGA